MVTNCVVASIDSNATGLRYTYEECPGILATGPDPTWVSLAPNSYSDFGGTTTLTPRQPIKQDRQNLKGIITDLASSAGFNADVTAGFLDPLLPGFFFAAWRTKPAYTIALADGAVIAAGADTFPTLTIEDAGVDFVAAGIIPGEWIFIGGDGVGGKFTNAANNGFKRVRVVAAKVLTFDKSAAPMVAETGGAVTPTLYLGQVIKNESDPELILKQTLQFERTLGSLDGLTPPQSEYVRGAYFNQMVLNMKSADKMTVDMTFVGLGYETRTQADGLKPGTRPDGNFTDDAYNTASDFRRMRVSLVSATDESITPLIAYFQDATLTIDNGVTLDKAIGVLGGFDSAIGNFGVTGSLTGYFTDVASLRAIQQNDDVTWDAIAVKGANGIVVDMPLISLGGGMATVALNAKVTLPITTNAATGSKIDANLNHTALWTSFNNLPALASTNP